MKIILVFLKEFSDFETGITPDFRHPLIKGKIGVKKEKIDTVPDAPAFYQGFIAKFIKKTHVPAFIPVRQLSQLWTQHKYFRPALSRVLCQTRKGKVPNQK